MAQQETVESPQPVEEETALMKRCPHWHTCSAVECPLDPLQGQRGPETPLSPTETVRVEWIEYEGERYLSVRVWSRNEMGKMQPTRNGISLRPELWPEVAQAVQSLLPPTPVAEAVPTDTDPTLSSAAQWASCGHYS